MNRFYIHTMGCKSNQFESAIIKENLIKYGFQEQTNISQADFYILNSCSVTHKSDNEALYLLRSTKHKNPAIKTILTGCIAQTEKENLLQYDFIDFIIGNDDKLQVGKVINFINSNQSKCFVSDIMQVDKFTNAKIDNMSQTRASLKIQDGCNNRCSYCIIPFARGKSRSASIEFITEQINHLTNKDFKEVVFTGIHIGQWGKDIGLTLLDLLKAIEQQTSIPRYRLGSLNPTEINDEMLEFLSKSEKFCPHFHLSLQSACNKTLKSMNRFYNVEDYLKLIDKINQTFDMPFLGSDIITGFSGETDEDFEITRQNLEKSRLSQIHTFPYSVRKGTIGENLPNRVPDIVKEQRATVVKNISAQKYTNFINNNLGKIREVLIEKHPDKNDGCLKGVTRNYITVHLNSKDLSFVNTLQQVKLTHFKCGKIYGELV